MGAAFISFLRFWRFLPGAEPVSLPVQDPGCDEAKPYAALAALVTRHARGGQGVSTGLIDVQVHH
jgi:hypothetical protein